MKKAIFFLLLTVLIYSCKKDNDAEIELDFNTGYLTPFNDKPFYKITDSIRFEMIIITNVKLSKNQFDLTLGNVKGNFTVDVIVDDEKRYINNLKGYFMPMNQVGDFDFNIKLSNSNSEKIITKKILVLNDLSVDDVFPEINRQRIINAFPLKYEFCNFTGSKIISSSNPTEIEMGFFNLDATTNTCSRRRVFINGFNGEVILNFDYSGKFESVLVRHGNKASYASLTIEKILSQLALFYGLPTESGVKVPNTSYAKISTNTAVITVNDNGTSVYSVITPKSK